MPELPEVETIRKDLEEVLRGKTIRSVNVLLDRVVSKNLLDVEGKTVGSIERKGKMIVVRFEQTNQALLVHLKMTGQLIYQLNDQLVVGGHPMAKIDDLPNAYTRVIFSFDGGERVFFNDVRTFGWLRLVSTEEANEYFSKYGLEPLSDKFALENFQNLLKNRRGNLKAFLLNQAHIAGIGNIYADEICHAAGVLPNRTVDSLKQREINELYKMCGEILTTAVKKRGTTFSNFIDATGKKGGYLPYLKVYKREGQPCYSCKTPIKKIKLAGRGTHFCPSCQK